MKKKKNLFQFWHPTELQKQPFHQHDLFHLYLWIWHPVTYALVFFLHGNNKSRYIHWIQKVVPFSALVCEVESEHKVSEYFYEILNTDHHFHCPQINHLHCSNS